MRQEVAKELEGRQQVSYKELKDSLDQHESEILSEQERQASNKLTKYTD